MGWKFILLLLTAQPIPANDAFGYDGAVVNYLLNGHYCNPSLIIPFPFSATHIYSIYPPVYQAALYLWMSVFGTSALVAMWFHFVLFVLYGVTLLAIFRRLQAPAWAVNLAGLFLFGITFDDRPDGLAQLMGMLAVYTWVRSQDGASAPRSSWTWLAVPLVMLACFTTPEVGGLYLGWIWLLVLGAARLRKARFSLAPLVVMTLAPVLLVGFVKMERPDLWAGFMEHARQTPSVTNLRRPAIGDAIKLVRTIPAILVIAVFLAIRWRNGSARRWLAADWAVEARPAMLLVSGLAIAGGLILGGLLIFSANWFLILAYFQPLLVGTFLTLESRQNPAPRGSSTPVMIMLVVLVSVRAVGMTTWGTACALDRSYPSSLQIVRTELTQLPPNSTVVMSSAYLYDAQRFTWLHFIHEDWTHRADGPSGKLNGDTLGLIMLRPPVLILTQFDYYRRYQKPLAELGFLPDLVTMITTNYARLAAPDSFPPLQQVVQHVAWAPVIVRFSWK